MEVQKDLTLSGSYNRHVSEHESLDFHKYSCLLVHETDDH